MWCWWSNSCLSVAVGLQPQKKGLAAYVASLIDRTLDWGDIKWLRTICGNMKVSGVCCSLVCVHPDRRVGYEMTSHSVFIHVIFLALFWA